MGMGLGSPQLSAEPRVGPESPGQAAPGSESGKAIFLAFSHRHSNGSLEQMLTYVHSFR